MPTSRTRLLEDRVEELADLLADEGVIAHESAERIKNASQANEAYEAHGDRPDDRVAIDERLALAEAREAALMSLSGEAGETEAGELPPAAILRALKDAESVAEVEKVVERSERAAAHLAARADDDDGGFLSRFRR